VFEVSSLERSVALDQYALRVPPTTAEHRIGELPRQPSPLLFTSAQTRTFRSRPAAKPNANTDGVKDGLLLVNAGDIVRYVLVDGVPVVRLFPGAEGIALDLLPGTYALFARSFLGDEIGPALTVSAPSRVIVASEAVDAPAGAGR
jgi:hypothetical protein